MTTYIPVLISYHSGLSLYLQGSAAPTAYAGSGTPWDTVSTTPYQIAANDMTGQAWTPVVAPEQVQYSGGPPFFDGALPVVRAVGNVQEVIPIQLRATSAANAETLRTTLVQALGSGATDFPPLLIINGRYAEIYGADFQPTPHYFNAEYGTHVIRGTLTITRSPYWCASAEQTILNAVSVSNANGGTDANQRSLGAATDYTGDLTYQGFPMSVALSGGDIASTAIKHIWAAVVKDTHYTAPGTAISTSSTTGVNIGSSLNATINMQPGIRTRLTCRVASPTSSLMLRAVVTLQSSGALLRTTKWIAPGAASAFVDLDFLDFGANARRQAGISGLAIAVQIQAKSTSGTATGTLTWIEVLDYYTYCKITTQAVNAAVTIAGQSAPRILNPPIPNNNADVFGVAPVALADARLWLCWDKAGTHLNTDAITVTATYLPVYRAPL